jgi:5-oxoprolinase (ATP-hydrolysing) subunit A
MTLTIDLNADIGEGFGPGPRGEDDYSLINLITSTSVACGLHSGDPTIMKRTCALAADQGVTIGAQVGYPELAGFGNRRIDYNEQELTADVLYQIAALDGIARSVGVAVAFVRPHGALCDKAAANEREAMAVVEAVVQYDKSLTVLAPCSSTLLRCAVDAGLPVAAEGYPDRGYTPAGTKIATGEPGACIAGFGPTADRAVLMATDRVVEATDGTVVPLTVQSLRVHGDTLTAVAFALCVRNALAAAGVELAPFTPGRTS